MFLPWANADPGKYAAGNQAVEFIQDFLKVLDVPYLSERSVKFRFGRSSSQRCLFSVPVDLVSSDKLSKVLVRLLGDLGMSSQDADECLFPLNTTSVEGGPLPHYLHLGVEDDRCKIYWEEKRPETLVKEDRFVLYRAWKWRVGESVARSDYVMLTTAQAARQAIEIELSLEPTSPLHDLLEQLQVSFALAQEPWPPLTVRIEEIQDGQPTGRNSLNVHLHRASLPLGTVAGTMFSLARDWQSTSRDTVIAWMANHGNEVLSNLSFGRDENDQPFVTCYHGARRHHPEKSDAVQRSDRIAGHSQHARKRSIPTA